MKDEREETIKDLTKAFFMVSRTFASLGFVKGAYAYASWLIPASLTIIISGLKPFSESPKLQYIAMGIIWGTSIPLIIYLLIKTGRSLAKYARAFGIIDERSSKIFSRISGIGWSVAWIAFPLIGILGSKVIPEEVIAPLSLIATLSIGVTSNAIAEVLCFRSSISLLAALVLYVTIALLLEAPLRDPWTVAIGGLFLSYMIAITMYIHRGLKIFSAPHEG